MMSCTRLSRALPASSMPWQGQRRAEQARRGRAPHPSPSSPAPAPHLHHGLMVLLLQVEPLDRASLRAERR